MRPKKPAPDWTKADTKYRFDFERLEQEIRQKAQPGKKFESERLDDPDYIKDHGKQTLRYKHDAASPKDSIYIHQHVDGSFSIETFATATQRNQHPTTQEIQNELRTVAHDLLTLRKLRPDRNFNLKSVTPCGTPAKQGEPSDNEMLVIRGLLYDEATKSTNGCYEKVKFNGKTYEWRNGQVAKYNPINSQVTFKVNKPEAPADPNDLVDPMVHGM